jgi:hypothetical protein
VWVKLAPSKIEGVGVVAVRDIPPGTNPFGICNDHLAAKELMLPFSQREVDALCPEVQQLVRSFFAPLTHFGSTEELVTEEGGLSYGVNATGLHALDVSWYLNHSADPNVSFKECCEENGFSTYETNKKISKGEELTVNYKEMGNVYYKEATNFEQAQKQNTKK